MTQEPSKFKAPFRQGAAGAETDDEARTLALMTRKIAHDMNNLITGIFGHAELAAMTPGLSNDVRANLDGVIDAAARASHLATQLLILGRRITSEPAEVDLRAAVELAGQVLRNQLPPTVELSLHRSEGALLIFADPGEVHQMILNLCENGRDAIGTTPGRITVKLSSSSFDDATLAVPRQEGWSPQAGAFASISIQDSGQGIHIDALPRLFEPFFSTKGSIGTGLGLTTVQRLVDALHGFVEVKTSLGQGSTFTVFLPLKSNSAPT
jgi:signal transduction histidine kinase